MPSQFISSIETNQNQTKVQLLSNDFSSFIFVDMENFKEYFDKKMLKLYKLINENQHAESLFTCKSLRDQYLKNFSVLRSAKEFAEDIGMILIDISIDHNSLIRKINSFKDPGLPTLAFIEPHSLLCDIFSKYIHFCLKIIDNDDKEINSKYINGINFSYSRLIEQLKILSETIEDYDKKINASSSDDQSSRDDLPGYLGSTIPDYNEMKDFFDDLNANRNRY